MSFGDELEKKFPQAVETLTAARSSGRLAHSFLIVSESERSRREFALLLAQTAACQTPLSSGKPDGTCPVCRALQKGNFPDLHTLTPVGKMYMIRVGDLSAPEPNTVRSFMNDLYLTATAGGHKVGIIHEADRMNREAQNALLKTLEEPPRDTTLILCTANPGALLPTTRSRCQQIVLPDRGEIFDFPGQSEVIAALQELVFTGVNDAVRAENAAAKLIETASALESEAENEIGDRFDEAIVSAENAGDSAMRKRLESRRSDEVAGAFMRNRAKFIGLIEAYCSQVFMLSCGITPEQLPYPEFLSGLSPLPMTSAERGAAVLKEAETLCRTLNYNVNLELALRTFALQLAL
ncbi:MAG: hypothetical protein IKA87_04715 [Lentisphaeria bacterium]|nr:hypothetical protein [Lentisphaeria bacterium]